jgi:hypothetical protein
MGFKKMHMNNFNSMYHLQQYIGEKSKYGSCIQLKKEQNFQEENLDRYLPTGDHHIKYTATTLISTQ